MVWLRFGFGSERLGSCTNESPPPEQLQASGLPLARLEPSGLAATAQEGGEAILEALSKNKKLREVKVSFSSIPETLAGSCGWGGVGWDWEHIDMWFSKSIGFDSFCFFG